MQGFAERKLHGAAVTGHQLLALADQVHFDAPGLGIVKRVVAKVVLFKFRIHHLI